MTHGMNRKERSTEQEILSLIGHLGIFMNQSQMANKGQGRILNLLMTNGELPQKELQARTGTTRAALSETLSKLETKGYITRRRSEEDGRVAIISLTEEGRAQAAMYSNGDPKELVSALSPEEQKELVTLLRKLMDSWKAKRGLTGGHKAR